MAVDNTVVTTLSINQSTYTNLDQTLKRKDGSQSCFKNLIQMNKYESHSDILNLWILNNILFIFILQEQNEKEYSPYKPSYLKTYS